MNTLQDLKTNAHTRMKSTFDCNEDVMIAQQQIIKEFFRTDSSAEIIESLHMMVEAFLFTDNLTQVTPEMREHIVNQLRVATLIAKLDRTCT
ncbi:hypothetical protein [Dyadobacter sandarakinus]|uniref:Uncharacterized protein n=1 Tax=Dyadobacter sandarakinus TaxID=2747268 RepID=A0ABX7I8C2_9BACT|nr:hypothetical protein [Dyadobacter sandarakinus]QRR02351.1 hypothetical protein HWI92_16260 [Dyadobacter sandarakinus]